MDYTISKTKRNLIIFSAVFLILKAITLAFVLDATDPVKPDLVLSGIERFLQIVAYGYILIVLFGYFKHHELKELQIITLSILALEIADSVIHFFFIHNRDKRIESGEFGHYFTLVARSDHMDYFPFLQFSSRFTLLDFDPATCSFNRFCCNLRRNYSCFYRCQAVF